MKPTYKLIVKTSPLDGSKTYAAQQLIGGQTTQCIFDTNVEAQAWFVKKHMDWVTRPFQAEVAS